jgi:endonuclease/exonuclease/phosphatase family metal-dependent hydrolase
MYPRNLFLFLILGLSQLTLSAQIFPKLGNDTLLDIATWNTEWLGDASNGPDDEEYQLNNVKALIERTDFDIVALQEVSNVGTYNTLSNLLASKYNTYVSTFSASQKMALYWRKNMFEVVGFETKHILSSENYVFASRPPLQVCLKTVGGTKVDTLYFIVLHLKANSDMESYNRRKSASALLKTYVETELKDKKFVILGDWNDDLDASTYQSSETPFKNFLDAKYTYPSKELTDAGKSSYAFSSTMLDHILNAKILDSFYYKNSARVFDNAGTYADNFSQGVSDHWPVYAFYNWKKLTTYTPPVGVLTYSQSMEVKIWPNPFNEQISISLNQPNFTIEVFNLNGELVLKENSTVNEKIIQTDKLASGVYFIRIEQEGSSYFYNIVK